MPQPYAAACHVLGAFYPLIVVFGDQIAGLLDSGINRFGCEEQQHRGGQDDILQSNEPSGDADCDGGDNFDRDKALDSARFFYHQHQTVVRVLDIAENVLENIALIWFFELQCAHLLRCKSNISIIA